MKHLKKSSEFRHSILDIPSCSLNLESSLKRGPAMPKSIKTAEIFPVKWNGTSEQIIRRCRSAWQNRPHAWPGQALARQWQRREVLKLEVQGRRLNRAWHNFHVGLASHTDLIKTRHCRGQHSCAGINQADAPTDSPPSCIATMICRSQDAVWDLLLQ